MPRDVFYEDLLRPLLFSLDPEEAHDLAHRLLKLFGWALSSLPYKYEGTDLQTVVAGKRLANPVGLAAGFDKNGTLVDVIGHLGFGFAEVGSLTARASTGNPRPRLFRLPDDLALVNRLGLNGEGAEKVAARLLKAKPSVPLAINIAKTHDPDIVGDAAIEDILHSFKAVKGLDAIYIAFNVSCPNTREGCMKERHELDAAFSEIQKLNTGKVPLFVKLSPDSSEQLLLEITQLASQHKLAGYICGNTSTSRSGLQTDRSFLEAIGPGGLSGAPLKRLTLDLCTKVAKMKDKSQQIIAVGGLGSGADVYELIRAGASAVELYTALIYKGPALPRQICRELSTLLRRDNLSLDVAIGIDVKR